MVEKLEFDNKFWFTLWSLVGLAVGIYDLTTERFLSSPIPFALAVIFYLFARRESRKKKLEADSNNKTGRPSSK
jgi:hypothetical protein